MKMIVSRPVLVALLTLLASSMGSILAADEEKGWSDTATLGIVSTSGNTESTTFGFKNKLWWVGERSRFETTAGGIRTRSIVAKFAIGDPNTVDPNNPDTFRVKEKNEVTAENYFIDARYDRTISDRFFWFSGAAWDRNEFAGVDSRTTGFGGVGNIWIAQEDHRFRTDYAVTYTSQENVVDDPDFDETFGGFRLSWAYLNKFGDNTTYTNDLIVNMNAEESEDWRADMINAVAVAMNSRLALKISHQFLYDNLPSMEELELFDRSPDNGGTKQSIKVFNELDEVDTILTASLVVNF